MKRVYLAVIMSIVAIIAIGCSNNDDNNNNANEKVETVTVKHELGETEVQKNPEKVVVFDFGSLDTLDKLGVDVTGVPQNNIPSYLDKYEAAEYENIGGLKEPDFEKLAEVDPDLIIISGRQADLYDQFEELGDTIYLGVDNDNYMESFEENVTILGEIFDKEEEAATAFDEIKAAIDELEATAEASDKNALIILANEDKISAYGPNSRFGIIHDVFGVTSVDEGIEASTHGNNVTFEYVVEQDPDLLYVVDRGAVVGGESSAKQVVENQLMESTKAYQNDNIVYLSPDYWYLSGGGLISVAAMVDEITASLE